MKDVAVTPEYDMRPEEASGLSRSNANGAREDAEGMTTQRAQARGRRRGPQTPAGKTRVALNALTHGLSSARLVLPGESRAEWETYRRTIVDTLAPVGPVEAALAERVASALHRLRRVTAYEEAAIAERQQSEPASARWLPHPLDIDKIIRFEAHLSRQLYQAMHEFESMRAERRGQRAPLLRVDVSHATGALAGPEASSV